MATLNDTQKKTEHNSTRATGRLLCVKVSGGVPLTAVVLPPPSGDKSLYNEEREGRVGTGSRWAISQKVLTGQHVLFYSQI